MSATIYIKSNGDDDLTPEQLELLHHYSDQARVWAHLLLKEAGLLIEAESKDELQQRLDKARAEWRSLRDEWIGLRDELIALNDKYGAAVVSALQQQYQAKKTVSETVLPAAKSFFPPETPAEALSAATSLAEKVKKGFTKLYPSRTEIGHTGPYLTPEESAEMFNPPDIEDLSEEEADAKIKAWEEKTGLDIAKWKQSGMSPIIDLARGFATNQGVQIIDPDTGATVFDPSSRTFNEDLMFDFAHEVLARALKSYNPFKAEDTGAGHEGRKASFGTYLYRTMVNEIKSRKEKYVRNLGVKDILPADADVPYILNALIAQGITPEDLKAKVDEAELTEDSPLEEWRTFYEQFQTTKKFRTNTVPLSLNQPTGDDESATIEEALAEKGREAGWAADLEGEFRSWLEARTKKPGSKLTPELIDRLVYVYNKFFVEGESLSQIARTIPTEKGKERAEGEPGLSSRRPRAKEIAFLKRHKVDVSSLPATLPPYASAAEDSVKRGKMIAEFFKNLKDTATPEQLEQVRKEYDNLVQPNAARIRNLIHGPYPGQTSGNTASIMGFLLEHPDIAEEWEKIKQRKRQSALEEFLTSISTLRKEGGLNYNLLRNKIVQKLSEINPQLFVVYTYLYESTFSNPDTARLMKLSPPRITGLKKKIVATLLELPEIQSFFEESEYDSISPLRRFIYNEGDIVKVQSINEVGVIENTSNSWFKVRLNNGNDVLTVKEDIQKHNTLLDSAQSVLAHYFGRQVVTPQCYLSFIAGAKPQLAILELRPSSEIKTTARLHINNNLIEITEFSEQYPDNLISILKGHLGVNASMDTPFTPLFGEVE